MINVVCMSCHTAVRVSGEPDEMEHLVGEKSDWFPDQFPCPVCPEKARVVDAIEPSALSTLEVHDLSVHEAYSAFHGLGLPKEQECGPTAVAELFKAKTVKRVDAELIRGTNRSVLRSIEFEDSSKMYFGSSPYGATVYRISHPRSIAAEVLDGK